MVALSSHIQRIDDEETIIDKYTIGKCLGEGNFAVVSLGVHTADDTSWAIKVGFQKETERNFRKSTYIR